MHKTDLLKMFVHRSKLDISLVVITSQIRPHLADSLIKVVAVELKLGQARADAFKKAHHVVRILLHGAFDGCIDVLTVRACRENRRPRHPGLVKLLQRPKRKTKSSSVSYDQSG